MTALPLRRDTYITVGEIADEMRVARMTVYRLLRSGDIPSVRIGRSFRVRRDAFEQYLATNSLGAA